MDVCARSGRGLGGLGYPWINTAIGVPVRHFECLPGPRAVLDSFLPQPLLHRRADRDGEGGRRKRRLPGAHGCGSPGAPAVDAVAAFREAFGPAPSVVLKGFKEAIGRIVRCRFEGTRKLLESGGLLYSCGLLARAGVPRRTGSSAGVTGHARGRSTAMRAVAPMVDGKGDPSCTC
jgi:hypothetical protein